MGNANSIDVSRPVGGWRVTFQSAAAAPPPFNPADWEGAMSEAGVVGYGLHNARALDYNTRVFRELARQGEALGYGKDV